jgi:hypothetical protein
MLDHGRGEYGRSGIHEFIHEPSCLLVSILCFKSDLPLLEKLVVSLDQCKVDPP